MNNCIKVDFVRSALEKLKETSDGRPLSHEIDHCVFVPFFRFFVNESFQ